MGNEGEGVGRLYGMDEVGMGTGPAGLKSKKKGGVDTVDDGCVDGGAAGAALGGSD